MGARGLEKRIGFPAAIAAVLLVVAFPLTGADAAGVQVDLIPNLRLEEGYYTNVYSDSYGEVDSFGTRLSPGLALRFTAPDDVKVQLSGKYERVWYHSSDAREGDDSTWDLRVDSSGAWRFTPSFSMQPSVYYLRTPDSYRRLQLLPSGDPNLLPVSIINYGTVKTDEFGGGLTFEYSPSPTWDIGLSGNYSSQKFPDDNTFIGLEDSERYGGGLWVTHSLSPKVQLGLGGTVTRNTYEISETSDSYYLGLRFNYQFTPLLRLETTAGVSQVRQKQAGTGEEDTETSPAGSFELSYRMEKSFVRFYGSSYYSGGSGYGETTRQITFGVSASKDLTREWRMELNGAYQNSKSVFPGGTLKIDSINGRGGVTYQALEWLAFDGMLSAEWQESGSPYDERMESYAVVLGFTLGTSQKIY